MHLRSTYRSCFRVFLFVFESVCVGRGASGETTPGCLVLLGQRAQIAEENLRRQDVRRADDDLPVLVGGGHLVRASHLREAGSAHDKHNDARHILDGRLRLVLVPVAVACAAALVKRDKNGEMIL